MQEQTQFELIDELRGAFATARTELGERLLAAALESGVPWDVATRAVAEGVAARFGSPEQGTTSVVGPLPSAPSSPPRASV